MRDFLTLIWDVWTELYLHNSLDLVVRQKLVITNHVLERCPCALGNVQD